MSEPAKRIYVYPEFTHTVTEQHETDVAYVRADLVDELIKAVEKVLRISDRNHDAWYAARAALAALKEEE
jgi:hypothetical protein